MAHPLFVTGILAELELIRHTRLVESSVNEIEQKIFELDFQSGSSMREFDRSAAEHRKVEKRQAWLNLGYLRNSLTTWSAQIVIMEEHAKFLNEHIFPTLETFVSTISPLHSRLNAADKTENAGEEKNVEKEEKNAKKEKNEKNEEENEKNEERCDLFPPREGGLAESIGTEVWANWEMVKEYPQEIGQKHAFVPTAHDGKPIKQFGSLKDYQNNSEHEETKILQNETVGIPATRECPKESPLFNSVTTINADDPKECLNYQRERNYVKAMRTVGTKIQHRLAAMKNEYDEKIRDCTMRMDGMAMANQWVRTSKLFYKDFLSLTFAVKQRDCRRSGSRHERRFKGHEINIFGDHDLPSWYFFCGELVYTFGSVSL